MTGGLRKIGYEVIYLDSTDIMQDHQWKTAAKLPSGRAYFQTITFNNTIFAVGKYIFSFYNIKAFEGGKDERRIDNTFDSILSYKAEEDTWEESGKMSVGKAFHAVGLVEDVTKFCWLE